MRRRTFLCLVPALALIGCASQSAQQPGGGLRFSENDRRIITEHYIRRAA